MGSRRRGANQSTRPERLRGLGAARWGATNGQGSWEQRGGASNWRALTVPTTPRRVPRAFGCFRVLHGRLPVARPAVSPWRYSASERSPRVGTDPDDPPPNVTETT